MRNTGLLIESAEQHLLVTKQGKPQCKDPYNIKIVQI